MPWPVTTTPERWLREPSPTAAENGQKNSRMLLDFMTGSGLDLVRRNGDIRGCHQGDMNE